LSSVTPHRERDFDGDVPATRAEHHDDVLDQLGVRFVEQAFELFAIPAKPHIHGGTEWRRSTNQGPDRHRLDQSALDPGDDRSRQLRGSPDIELADLFSDA